MRIELTDSQKDMLRIAAATVAPEARDRFVTLVLLLLDRRSHHSPTTGELGDAIRLTLGEVTEAEVLK